MQLTIIRGFGNLFFVCLYGPCLFGIASLENMLIARMLWELFVAMRLDQFLEAQTKTPAIRGKVGTLSIVMDCCDFVKLQRGKFL